MLHFLLHKVGCIKIGRALTWLCVVSHIYHKRKNNVRDFDKSKAANLLKMLKGEHPTKKWQNCGTEVLCVMLIYDRAELTRIVNKVLGKDCYFLDH